MVAMGYPSPRHQAVTIETPSFLFVIPANPPTPVGSRSTWRYFDGIFSLQSNL